MVKDLSPAELSALWLLHDRHTNRRAVEKAIELGLPLWTEAVHLARACHRSNMDLAGGTFYMLGSDFVDNEDASQYDYHEKGRYPDAYANNTSKILQEGRSREKERAVSNSDARSCFESEKSKHIQLLLGGVSSLELENFQSERSSLEICEISDDEESISVRSYVEPSKSSTIEKTNNVQSGTLSTNSIQTTVRGPVSEKSSQEENGSSIIGSAVKQSKTVTLKGSDKESDSRYDLSFCDAQILRSCEVSSATSTRRITLMNREEFERRLRSENESRRDKKNSPQNKTSTFGDSEIEDTRRNTVLEIDNAVSQLAPDLEMNEVISKLMKEDVAAEFSEAGTPTKRSKRHYVEPFDGDASVSESEFSDTNIDVNILYEISELRREEGASSPSSCSIDSDDVIPPDVCIWHPQSCTYNIDLITYFRASSPCEETVTVLIPKEFIEAAVKAPGYEEISTTVRFSKHLPHSGAFTRRRGYQSAIRSLSLPAVKTEKVVLSIALDNTGLSNETCELEIIRRCREHILLDCKASKEECFLLHCCVTYVKPTYQTCVIERTDSRRESICFETEASTEEHCLLNSNVTNKNKRELECFGRKEDRQSCSVHLDAKSSSVDSCSFQCDFQNDADLSERCEIKYGDNHSDAVLFVAKASTSCDSTCGMSLSLMQQSETCTVSFTDYQRFNTSVTCKAPVSTEVNGTHELATKAQVKSCSSIRHYYHSEKALLQCSVPKCEIMNSYWVFDIMVGNSAVIVLEDKGLRKASHSFKAVPGGKPSISTAGEETLGRKRDDSLNEVLMLLEAGAMPSQFIETSPPRPLLAKKGNSLRSHVLDQNRIFEESDTSVQNQPEVIVISPKKRPPSLSRSPLGLEERSSVPLSDVSGLSDSPDRLIICDEEDVFAHEDSAQVVENLEQVSSNMAKTMPERIKPSFNSESNTEKVLAEVSADKPLRKVLRKRSIPNETATARKRSAAKLQSVTVNSEVSYGSTNARPAIGTVSAIDIPTTTKKVQKLVEKMSPPAPSPPSKTSMKKATKQTVKAIENRRLAKSVHPTPEKYVVVSRKASTSTAGPSCTGVSSEGINVTPEKKLRRKTVQHLGSSLTLRKRTSLPADLLLPSCSRAAKKRRSPVLESYSTETIAAFAAAPPIASTSAHLPSTNRESASFKCCAAPIHEPEFRLIEPSIDRETDFAELEFSAVSPPIGSFMEELSGSDLVQASVTAISTIGKRGRRKAASSTKNASPKPKQSLVSAGTIAVGEKRRNSKRLSERSVPEQILKKRKISATAGLETQKNSSSEISSTTDMMHARISQKDCHLANTSKSRSAVHSEQGKPAQIKATSRSSKRKSRIHDNVTSSSGCITDAQDMRAVPELELDTDVVLRTVKRRKTIATEMMGRNRNLMVDSAINNAEPQLVVPVRRKSSRLITTHPAVAGSSSEVEPRQRTTATCSSSTQRTSDEEEVLFVESGFAGRRRRSLTPPILVVAVDFTSSFVPVKRDNNRCAEPITLPACNRGEAISLAIYSSDTAEVLNALALDIIIREASALSAVNLATFAHFVLNLFDPVRPIFAPLEEIEPSTLPPNFTTIFERATPLQYRHRLDYNSFNNMLLNRLPENGLHALTLDSRKVSMLKITKFVDTIKEAVEEICEELRNRENLSKAEIKKELDLSGEVQQLITSRYVETMMKMADACGEARDIPLTVIADRFHLLLCGWQCFLQQGGVLRVRVQICPGRSHPGIVDITTAWLDRIDTILSRAQATKSMRTAAFAVSLAQEKTVISKVWYQMASHTRGSNEDRTFIFCEECRLYFRNEDTDFIHNRVFHQKSRECEECYDMFHTLLGLDLHMVGCHKRNFAVDL